MRLFSFHQVFQSVVEMAIKLCCVAAESDENEGALMGAFWKTTKEELGSKVSQKDSRS